MAIARPRVSALDGDPSPPFQLTAHPSVFWDGPPYREALETLRRAVRENRGVLLLTGDVGCGKTILANVLAESLEREGVVVGALRHPHVDACEFLQAIAHSLGLTTPFDSRTACLSVLREFVGAARAASRPTLFIVDEAQSLPREVLAEIARLGLRNRGGVGLNLLLTAQETFEGTLREPENADLAHAIAMTCRLGPLTEADVDEYVRYQLRRAGIEQAVFETTALREIAEASGGNPRLVNTLGGLALGVAGRQGLQVVPARLLRQCAVDLAMRPDTDRDEAPPLRQATRSARSPSAVPRRRYALAIVTAGTVAVAAASFASAVHVVKRSGRPAAVAGVAQPERRVEPHLDAVTRTRTRLGAAAGDVTPVETVPPREPRAPVASTVVPSVAWPAPAPRPSPVTPTTAVTTPGPRAVPPAATPPSPSRAARRPVTDRAKEPAPVATTSVPPPAMAPASGAAASPRQEPHSPAQDPGAIIDWMLRNTPARWTALPDPVPTDR